MRRIKQISPMDWTYNLIIVLLLVRCRVVSGQGLQGPVFVMEPPANLVFSNTTGSQVSCSAHGAPSPQVDWLLQDGSHVTAVPGLRQTLGNGTLYFPPFRAQDYRKDVHLTVYRCRAANQAGAIISRDVAVSAIVRQHYEIQVYRAHVLTGNTAVLTCIIPEFIKDYVTVSSWFRDDTILLPGRSEAGGRYLVTSGTGNLHIRSARMEDGASRYSCLTVHSLTHERKRSAPAILAVTEATGSMPPRLTSRLSSAVSVERGSDVHLSCSAQGNPPPTFTWFREINGQMEPVVSTIRISPAQDVLYIRRVEPEDAGLWICRATNQFGEQRMDTQLTITAHLDVHVLPQLQVVNSGKSTTFNCSVEGSPVGSVQWLRNGEPLLLNEDATAGGGDATMRLLSPLVLQVAAVTRMHRGMYQCIVRNERESAQGSAELRLGDTVPELQYTFIEQSLTPGPHISLRCSASGSPPPQFKWTLDGEPLSELTAGNRYAVGQYVDQAGDVISHLNISNVRVEDGGLYACQAVNSLGSTSHMARLNIYGPPSIRAIGPIKAVAGSDVTLQCPFSGYPISSVKWERRGQELPLDLRHKVDESQANGALAIKRVDPISDAGTYKCLVMSRNGELVQREIQLIVNSPPVLEPFAFPNNLQEGGRAQVSCSVTSGDMPIQFFWYKDGAPLSVSLQIEERTEEFFSILIFKEVNSRHSGGYTCVARNSAARVNYTAQLMVKVAPQWIIEPNDVTTLLGNPVAVHCQAKGYPIPQLTWLRGEDKMSSEYQPLMASDDRMQLLANGSILIDSVRSEDEGHYLCRAVNGIGSGLSKVVYIGVNEPARFEISQKNISTKRGEQASLFCEVLGDHPMQVSWTHNSNRLDLNSFRVTMTEVKTNNGLRSSLIIARTDRQDSGIYKCAAANMFGRSELIINVIIQERPDPPSNVEVIEVGSRFICLTWLRAFDGNSPLLGYLVQYQIVPVGAAIRETWDQHNPPGSTNLTLAITPSTGSEGMDGKESALVGALHPATTYSMRMLSINHIDQSVFTDPPVVVKTQEEAPIESPKNVQVETGGPGELILTWQVPPRDSWNGELLGYIVTWNEQGASMNNSKSLTIKGWATTKAQLTGLRKFNRYDVIIRAFNSVSSGPQSVPVVGTTLEGVPEAAPLNVMCSQILSQSMKISWSPPPLFHHGGLIKGYKVFYRPMSPNNMEIPVGSEVKRTTSTETYLHLSYKFTNYSIRVLAYTGAGDGPLTVPVYCMTEEDVPGPPANIKAAALTGDSILISWLAPAKPNGNILLYSIYSKEAGREGKHTTHIVRVEGTVMPRERALLYKIRGLTEHQLYEFWITATTSIGEGETSNIVAQATNTRAPARIASFSQTLHRPVKSQVVLPCIAVGNPTPRTRWLHRDKPITFSAFYEVTTDGHLNIHSADQSLAGNYTCSAKNLFGEDEITYTMLVLLAPGSPILELEYASSFSIRLRWNPPVDGGTGIQGYNLRWKKDADEWHQIELSPEMSTYTLDDLKCGTIHHMYLMSHNRVGNGSPSSILTIKTKGDKPSVMKQKDLLASNASMVQINLFAWPDGGCPISHFTIEYRPFFAKEWSLISNYVIGEMFLIQNLMPATWYQLKISAHNDAGVAEDIYNFATTTLAGDQILPPVIPDEVLESSNEYAFKKYYLIVPLMVLSLLIGIAAMWLIAFRKKERESDEEVPTSEEPSDEKTVERDNRRNCQQIYMSSGVKPCEKLADESSEMYEISPYATFSVPGNGSRSVTTSTLDYTVQFKTFGHLENEDLNAKGYPPVKSGKHSWGKHRYYNTNTEKRLLASSAPAGCAAAISGPSGVCGASGVRSRPDHPPRPPRPCDSESDDTSDSPCNYCTGSSAPTYRMPIKVARGEGFRPNSSTESNEISPVSERWQHTPRHLAVAGNTTKYKEKDSGKRDRDRDRDRHHRPSSSSSSSNGEDSTIDAVAMRTPTKRTVHQPLMVFADNRELSETECDRERTREMSLASAQLSTELANLLLKYQEKKLQEQREFTIHV